MNINGEQLLTNDNIVYLNGDIQRIFIVKVYTIVWLQLLFTSFFVGLCKLSHDVSDFLLGEWGMGIMFISFNLWICLSVLFVCFTEYLKQYPYNWIFVCTYTLLLSYFIGFISIQNSIHLILLSGGSTLFLFSGLTLYAWQTKIDYTTKGNYLLISLLGLFTLGVLTLFLQLSFLHILYPLLGATLFSFYIVYDTQLLLGSGREMKYTPDDFAIVSISLYLDIVNLFIFILNLVGVR
jgi:FtsH-binding integral membrane protein